MKAEDIQDALLRYYRAGRGYRYQLMNAYVFKWESDFFCLAQSGYSYEVEVKVSRSDYFADFKKTERHRILSWPTSTYTNPIYKAPDPPMARLRELTYKEGLYYSEDGRRGHRPPQSTVEFIPMKEVCPNKFMFACPEGLIQKEEVPDYAGLIYIKDDRRFKPTIIKRPPAIHRQKRDFTKILLKKYYWAYLNSLNRTDIGKNFDFPEETDRQKMIRTK